MASLGEYIGAGTSTTKLLLPLNGSSADSSGNGNNGTDTDITYVDGKFGKCASFTRVNWITGSSISVGNIDSTSVARATFIHWIKLPAEVPSTTYKDNPMFSSNNWDGAGKFVFDVQYVSSGSLFLPTFYIYGQPEPSINYSATKSVADDKWHCIIVSVDTVAKTYSYYLDGQLDIVRTLGTTPSMNFTSCLLGAWTISVSDKRFFKGLIDETIIENRAWTPQQIAKYYANAKGRYATL